jgi:hypothetical protein
MGGGKCDSFLGTMPPCSPCSWVAAPSPNPTGVRGGPEGPLQAAAIAQGLSTVTTGGIDGCEPSADLFQPMGSIASSAGNYHVDVSEAKLSRPSLLRGVG